MHTFRDKIFLKKVFVTFSESKTNIREFRLVLVRMMMGEILKSFYFCFLEVVNFFQSP